jgi:uncharacterized damage-inducible protein DinB
MSWLEQYRALARYNRWMNRKLYASSAELDDARRKRDRGAFFKSIHGTLNHLLLAGAWLARFTGDSSVLAHDASGQRIVITSLAQELFADFDALSRERARLDDLILAYAAQLDEEQLMHTLSYKTSAGLSQSHVLWWALGHFFNHQTHHRGQLSTLLSQEGLDVGVTDLAAMLRDEALAARG